MGKAKIPLLELDRLIRMGVKDAEIARRHGVSRSAVSQARKKLNVAISRHVAIREAPAFAKRQFDAMDQYLKIAQSTDKEIQWFDQKISEVSDKEKGKYQRDKLPYIGESRRQIKLSVEIAQAITWAERISKIIEIILEEIRNESEACADRIIKRLVGAGLLATNLGFNRPSVRDEPEETSTGD